MHEQRNPFPRSLAILAIAIGLAGGSYGIATAASGNGNSSANATTTSSGSDNSRGPCGHQRGDETLLTDGAATSVREAALARLPGATVVRVETDADGHAPYEAHVISNGTSATVYVDKSFNVVSVASR